MDSKRLWATTAAVLFALSSVGPHSSRVWAQTTSMAACPAGWDWNKNSLGQDPCTVSSMLDAACRGVGSYTIPPLNSTQNYVPPQKDTTSDLLCDCDTIMYSLYMACSTCQGGIIYSWTKWIAQCDTVYVTQYPHDIPYGTAVPHWAFYNVTTLPDQTYSDSVATSVGRDPEATPKALSTATFGTSSSSRSNSFPVTLTSSGSGSNPTSNSDNTSGSTKTNTTAIIGGAVGGGVVLIIIAVVAGILISRRKRGGNQPPLQPLHSQDTMEYQRVQQMAPMLSPTGPDLPYNPPVSPNMPYNTATQPLPYNTSTSPNHLLNVQTAPNPPMNTTYYNPEDPTTFPPPMGDGQSSTGYSNATTLHGPSGPGRYGGVPEL